MMINVGKLHDSSTLKIVFHLLFLQNTTKKNVYIYMSIKNIICNHLLCNIFEYVIVAF